ncbi:MAG: DNA glycosylase AlkZ-like family protein [Actinomycetota bacterium]
MEALRAVVAAYATHPTAPLALWARTRSLTPAAFRRLDRDRKALRIPGMRGTIFLVPHDSAARVFTTVPPPAAWILRSLKRHGFSTREYERFAERILAAARQPLRAAELQDVAGIKGRPLGTVLRCLRYEGRLLALGGDSLHVSAHSYLATSAWASEGLDAGDPSEALAWLASEYLRAYGPARVEDFAWWAGMSKRAAAEAIGAHETVDISAGLLLPARDEAAFGRVDRVRGTVDLLPKWDSYTMGHAPDGRHRFVHPDAQRLVYTPIGPGFPGDGNPVVLVDGQAVATWTYTVRDGAGVQPFDTLGRTIRRKVDERLDAVARFLGR